MALARLFPLLALTAVACTSADVLRIDSTPRPATEPASIQLIAQEPTQPYKVIAIVSTRSETILGRARDRLIKEAARLGGHAILLDNSSVTHVGGDQSERTQLTGKVIVFADTARSN